MAAYTAKDVDESLSHFEATARKLLSVKDSMVRREAAEKDFLVAAEKGRDLMDVALHGDKYYLAEVYGDAAERIIRYRRSYDSLAELGLEKDQRWGHLSERIASVEAVIADIGSFKPRSRATEPAPESLEQSTLKVCRDGQSSAPLTMSGLVSINIKTLEDDNLELKVTLSLTIDELKDLIQEELGISADKQVLVQGKTQFDDGQASLDSLGVDDGATILMLIIAPKPPDNGEIHSLAVASASNEWSDEILENLFDGGSDTQMNTGDKPPGWIQLTWPRPMYVATVRLQISQQPAGPTTHVLVVDGEETHTWAGHTENCQWLETDVNKPATELRIKTTESPSWVAWKQLNVVGRPA